MNKVYIFCEATDCLQHSKYGKTCGALVLSFITISKDGRCTDYTSSTETEIEYE